MGGGMMTTPEALGNFPSFFLEAFFAIFTMEKFEKIRGILKRNTYEMPSILFSHDFGVLDSIPHQSPAMRGCHFV